MERGGMQMGVIASQGVLQTLAIIMKTTNSQLSCYLIEKTIGKGTFGKVKKAIHKYSGEPVAIKILEKSKIKDITDVERVSRELHILKLVRHSSIAQLYEIIETSRNIFIVMEFAQNGEFFDYIMDGKVKSEKEAHYYFAQIVSGLEYMHRLGITHRDIKPENMLLDVHNRLKIVDFGLSNMYKTAERLTTACGSPCYASPEMIRGEEYDPELTDVWSLGIVLFTMVMAKLPFEDDNTSVLYSKIKSGLYIIDKKVSPEYKDLVSRLINVKADCRLRLSEIKKHPWFNNFSLTSSYGINVGFEKIPIDEKIVKIMENFDFPASQTRRYLEYNVKNECTTTYYLFLKKNFKIGHGSDADICSDNFNQQLIYPILRKRLHKSIDFNALIERTEPHNLNATKPKLKERKCLSQMKQMHIETSSVGKTEQHDWESANSGGLPKSIKKFNLYNLSTKSKESKKMEAMSLMDRKKSTMKTRGIDENDYRSVINRMVRENRRLQTEHVREIYNKDPRDSQKRELEVSEMFWKKRQSVNKGQTRYGGMERERGERGSNSRKNLKNNYV